MWECEGGGGSNEINMFEEFWVHPGVVVVADMVSPATHVTSRSSAMILACCAGLQTKSAHNILIGCIENCIDEIGAYSWCVMWQQLSVNDSKAVGFESIFGRDDFETT